MQPDPLEATNDTPTDTPIETPVDDAAEQAMAADPDTGEEGRDYADDVHRGMEVAEWDATEQARTVTLDDDYR